MKRKNDQKLKWTLYERGSRWWLLRVALMLVVTTGALGLLVPQMDDAGRIAYLDGCDIVVVHLDDLRREPLLNTSPGCVETFDISPDGRWLAYTIQHTVHIAPRHAPTQPTASMYGGEAGTHWSPRWSPDGRAVAYWSVQPEPGAPWRLMVARMDAGRVTAIHEVGQYVIRSPHASWSPDGEALVFSMYYDGILDPTRVDIASGQRTRLTETSWVEDAPDWSPDGRTVLLSSQSDGHFRAWTIDLAYPARPAQVISKAVTVYTPRWSPDGQRIAFVGDDQSGTQEQFDLFVMNADGSNLIRIAALRSGTRIGPVWLD